MKLKLTIILLLITMTLTACENNKPLSYESIDAYINSIEQEYITSKEFGKNVVLFSKKADLIMQHELVFDEEQDRYYKVMEDVEEDYGIGIEFSVSSLYGYTPEYESKMTFILRDKYLLRSGKEMLLKFPDDKVVKVELTGREVYILENDIPGNMETTIVDTSTESVVQKGDEVSVTTAIAETTMSNILNIIIVDGDGETIYNYKFN